MLWRSVKQEPGAVARDQLWGGGGTCRCAGTDSAAGTHWREEGGGGVVVLSACTAPAQVPRLRLRGRARDPAWTDTTDLSTGLYYIIMSLLARLASSCATGG